VRLKQGKQPVLVYDSTMKNSSDFRNWKSSENESIDKNTSARHEERENGLFNDTRKETESKRKDRQRTGETES
jgi:hypothetical protein